MIKDEQPKKPLPDIYSEELRETIQGLMIKSPLSRLTLPNLIKKEFMKDKIEKWIITEPCVLDYIQDCIPLVREKLKTSLQ